MTLARRQRSSAWPMSTLWTDDWMDEMFRDMMRGWYTGPTMIERTHPMRLEEFVDGDTYVVRAELPGIDPEKDVEITLSDGVLRVSAQREERTEEDRPEQYRSEFHYGRFERFIRLPAGTTEADVKASYTDGILEVRMPTAKAEAPTATKVPITHA